MGRSLVVVALLAALCLVSARSYLRDDRGIVVKLQDGHYVGLFVEGLSAFRVSVAYDKIEPHDRIDSPMVDNHATFAPFASTQVGDWFGIKTSFGEVRINIATGAFVMFNAQGETVTASNELSRLSSIQEPVRRDNNDTCTPFYNNMDASSGTRTPSHPDGLKGQTQASCCAECNKDPDCTFWVWATPDHPDPNGNCWLLMNVPKRVDHVGRVCGGQTLPGPSTISLYLGRNNSAQYYGAGGSAGSSFTQTQSYAKVGNTYFWSPHYWSTEGYTALAVSMQHFIAGDIASYPANWKWNTQSNANVMQFDVSGKRADLYLMPAKTPYDGMRTYWQLTGAPQIPPRYAFGFMACRWGWESRQYIHDTLLKFRNGNYPIDSFISDFEWYTPKPDYELPLWGDPNYHDFTYNSAVFPAPVDQLKEYHDELHVRFGGIRKPRLGNSDLLVMARGKNWCLPSARDLNYSIPEVRQYYTQQNQHFLPEGVDFWWDDEGETQYFTYHFWNQAQVDGLTAYDKTRRFFSINRAHTPGLQRLGATVWTGDIPVSWQALQQTPGYVLNWGMAGAGYVTCDIGGFSGGNTDGKLLVRWYQAGVFISFMRVHSYIQNTPHFPFMYEDQYAKPMQKAMNLRYMLAPYIYSLAHDQYYNGRPMLRGIFFDYPQDSMALQQNTEWFAGDGLLVAPVVQEDNSRSVYLPAATWFEYGSTKTRQGPTQFQLYNVDLDFIPMYVRAGTIIPHAPVVQYLDQLPGGPLDLHVYGNANAQFVMYEDDGMGRAYEGQTPASSAVRVTSFTYTESTRTLSWRVSGSFQDSHCFTQMVVRGFFIDGTYKSNVITLSTEGSVVLK